MYTDFRLVITLHLFTIYIGRQRTVVICGGSSSRISCGTNREIQINKVNWGRTDNSVCGTVAKGSPPCINEEGLMAAKQDCDRKEFCVLV